MVTGASTADLALILVDARKGLVEQSRRHAFLCSLLRVPHLVLCVNKMDLVDWSQEVYERIADEFTAFAAKLDAPDLTVVPISALRGDNIVTRSDNMPWYEGPSLLHHLERVHIASDRNLVDVRFPVQYVIRPQSTTVTDYRGYAGQVASGVLKPGDEVMVLPSGFTSRIAAVETADGPVQEAFPPMSVTVRLADEIDISRGDLICRPNNAPAVAQDIEAMVCWMDETAPCGSAAGTRSSTPPGRLGRSCAGCTTGWTSTRCTATSLPTSCGSTRSAGCDCVRRCRCWPTSTAATAPPAASSSSTRRPTARWAPP